MSIFSYITDRLFGKVSFGQKRSSLWSAVRASHLKEHPVCELCGGKKGVEVHHKQPFHLNPELELEETNLITLCRKNQCHLLFGHLRNFKSFNADIETDVATWKDKIANRPN